MTGLFTLAALPCPRTYGEEETAGNGIVPLVTAVEEALYLAVAQLLQQQTEHV
jgi:hypothetical protein